jgi:hypothetical protein
MGPANEGATSSSRDLSRVADVVIRPEEQNRNHWTNGIERHLRIDGTPAEL